MGASQFSDAVTDDSRLVMRVLDEAVQDGAVAINYMQANGLLTDENGQVVGATLTDTADKFLAMWLLRLMRLLRRAV